MAVRSRFNPTSRAGRSQQTPRHTSTARGRRPGSGRGVGYERASETPDGSRARCLRPTAVGPSAALMVEKRLVNDVLLSRVPTPRCYARLFCCQAVRHFPPKPMHLGKRDSPADELRDSTGQLVKTPANGKQKPGRYNLTWSREDSKGLICACEVCPCGLSAENGRFGSKAVLTE